MQSLFPASYHYYPVGNDSLHIDGSNLDASPTSPIPQVKKQSHQKMNSMAIQTNVSSTELDTVLSKDMMDPKSPSLHIKQKLVVKRIP
jgi:hypothetical protein